MKKGFTLIELLAVIVILAIIALIATPIVLNIIEDSKNSAMIRSSEMYISAVEYSIAEGVLNNQRVTDGTYNILTSGNICIEYTERNCTNELTIEVKGEKPISGTITIENGVIKNHTLNYASNVTIVDGTINKGEIVQSEPGLYKENGEFVSWNELIENEIITVNDNSVTYSNSDLLSGKLIIGDNVTSIVEFAFEASLLESIIIPDSVTSIGDSAFMDCKNLSTVIIPKSVRSIGYGAFSDCESLTNVVMENGVTSIAASAFMACKNLSTITIPDSVTSIGFSAFEASGLESITIPQSVTSIAASAFMACSDLQTIYYEGTEEEWNAISFGEEWDYDTPEDKEIIFNYKV